MTFLTAQKVNAQSSYQFKPDHSGSRNHKYFGTWIGIKGSKTYILVFKETEITVGKPSKMVEGSLQVLEGEKQILKLPRNSTDQFLIGSESISTRELICFIEDKQLNLFSQIIITLLNSNSFKWRFDKAPEVSSTKKLLSAPTDIIFHKNK